MIVVNTTILSNLAWVDRLEILKELFGEIVIPIQVYEEILADINEGYSFLTRIDRVTDERWIIFEVPTGSDARSLFRELLASVGYGEAAAIALAKEKQLVFFSDDKKARQVASQQGVDISGTLGTLELAIEQGMMSIEEADDVLREMIRGGYRSPIESMKELNDSNDERRD